MKKLLLLPFLLITLFSCSTDDADEVMIQEETAAAAQFSAQRTGIEECVGTVRGYTNINVENGFGDPIVEFYSVALAQMYKKQHMVYLQVQPLSDCEDMNSEGDITTYPGKVVNLVYDQRIITLKPTQLPASCYKWRFMVTATPNSESQCTTLSEWYEAPLF
jgi:hypothetical protein